MKQGSCNTGDFFLSGRNLPRYIAGNWFWRCINTWSRISTIFIPYLIFPVLKYAFKPDIITEDFEVCLIIIVARFSILWLVVKFLTPLIKKESLKAIIYLNSLIKQVQEYYYLNKVWYKIKSA